MNLESFDINSKIVRIIAAVIAVLILGYTYTKPVKANKTARDTAVAAQKVADSTAATLTTEIEQLKTQSTGDNARVLIRNLAIALPRSVKSDRELDRFNRLSKLTKVRITNFTLSPPTPSADATYKSAALSIDMIGSYQNLLRTVNAMQLLVQSSNDKISRALGPIIKLDTFDFSPTVSDNFNRAALSRTDALGKPIRLTKVPITEDYSLKVTGKIYIRGNPPVAVDPTTGVPAVPAAPAPAATTPPS